MYVSKSYVPLDKTVPAPPSKFPKASSKLPEILSNKAVSSIKASSITTTSVFVPVKLGSCVELATKFRFLTLLIKATLLVALSDFKPILSTDLIKYVPVKAGTVTVFAGLDTLSIKVIALENIAPLVKGLCLIM